MNSLSRKIGIPMTDFTTSPKSMNCKFFTTARSNHMDLGTSRFSSGGGSDPQHLTFPGQALDVDRRRGGYIFCHSRIMEIEKFFPFGMTIASDYQDSGEFFSKRKPAQVKVTTRQDDADLFSLHLCFTFKNGSQRDG